MEEQTIFQRRYAFRIGKGTTQRENNIVTEAAVYHVQNRTALVKHRPPIVARRITDKTTTIDRAGTTDIRDSTPAPRPYIANKQTVGDKRRSIGCVVNRRFEIRHEGAR